MKKIVSTKNAPVAIGPYSQAVSFGNLLFTSGQIPLEPSSNNIPSGIESQTKQALENLKNVLEAGGSSLNNVLKVNIFIKNMNDFAIINEIYGKYFTDNYPARCCVEVARLPKDVLIEIEGIAYTK